MLKALRATAPVLSRTSTVNVDVPTAVGVPTTRASGRLGRVFSTNCVPAGTLPATTLNRKVDGPGGSLTTRDAR